MSHYVLLSAVFFFSDKPALGQPSSFVCAPSYSAGATRFATSFIMLRRLLDVKADLMAVVGDREWQARIASDKRTGVEAAQVKQVINDADGTFWTTVSKLVHVSAPVVRLLRLVDGNTPCIGKIYQRCSMVLTHIQALTGHSPSLAIIAEAEQAVQAQSSARTTTPPKRARLEQPGPSSESESVLSGGEAQDVAILFIQR